MNRFTAEDILRMAAKPEALLVEFKEAKGSLPKSFWESYSAFANTDGGTIILGVKEEKGTYSIQGVEDADKIIQDLWNSINNTQKVSANILFNRQVYAVDCNEKTVVVVEVPRALRENKPVFTGSNPYTGSFRRNGEGDYRCREESVDAMIRDKCRETADCRLIDTLRISDLNQETLQRYRNLFKQWRPADLTVDADNEEFLCRHGVAQRDEKGIVRPLLAAVLMFGDFHTIQDECPHYFVDYRERLDDNPRYSDRVCPFTVGFSGNLFDFYFRVVNRLVADVKVPFKLNHELFRIDDTPVHKALRECLANTLIHADYLANHGIVIEKHFRHVVFSNPGILRLPPDIAISGGLSNTRNERLFNLFALVDIGEKLGTGLVQLYALWEKNGWPRPELRELFELDRTSLTLDYNDPEDGTNASTVSSQSTPQKADGTPQKNGIEKNENGIENGTDNQAKHDIIVLQRNEILSLLRQSPDLTTSFLAERLGLSERSLMRRIAELKLSGALRRVGPDKGGHWEVLKP